MALLNFIILHVCWEYNSLRYWGVGMVSDCLTLNFTQTIMLTHRQYCVHPVDAGVCGVSPWCLPGHVGLVDC